MQPVRGNAPAHEYPAAHPTTPALGYTYPVAHGHRHKHKAACRYTLDPGAADRYAYTDRSSPTCPALRLSLGGVCLHYAGVHLSNHPYL
jgi:hypothetical protein